MVDSIAEQPPGQGRATLTPDENQANEQANRDGVALVPLPPGDVPRLWQTRAMLAIRGALLAGKRRILVSAATGTGKGTMIAAMAVKVAVSRKRLLFLVHRDELIDDVMGRVRKVDQSFTVGKVRGDVNEVDRQAVFASVQSLHKRRLPTLGHFDFVITDEAHHATAPSYRRVYERVAEVNPNWRHIGFTATPFRSKAGGKTSGLGEAFEELTYEYSLSQAIADGALCPLRGIRVETKLDLSGIDPDDEEAVSKVVDTDDRNRIVAEKAVELVARKQAICFGVTVEHSKRLAQAMMDAGIRAAAVWGDDPYRANKVGAYKAGKLQILCNCGILTEGFDAPATEAVLLVRPVQSRGLYAQMVGRVTRLSPGKVEGIVLDFAANSSTHDLASIKDLSLAEKPLPRINPMDEVRHRKADWGVGRVEEVRGWESPEEEGDALVEWMGRKEWSPCKLLVLNLPKGEPKETIIAPVIGSNAFPVSLFGEGRRPAWYRYEGSKGVVLVAKTQSMSAIIRKVDDVWQLWEWDRKDPPKMVAAGTFAECEAAATLRPSQQGLDMSWQFDPASEAQKAALRKFRVRREGLTKGEAILIMEMKIMLVNIDGRA